MDIVIPTYGRPQQHRQVTLQALRAEGILPILVVQYREQDQYSWYAGPIQVLPDEIRTVAPTRDWIIRAMPTTFDKVVCLDDDLHFFIRREDDRTKFKPPQGQDLRLMLHQLSSNLDVFPHVGIAPREGGNRNTERYIKNTRLMRVLAFQRSALVKENIFFADMGIDGVMEDFHVSLSLLEHGYDTMMINDYCSNQAEGSGAAGGCSSYRTPELQDLCARRLANLHPGLVKVVTKDTKTAWGGGSRTDVIVQWKRARALGELFKQSQEVHDQV